MSTYEMPDNPRCNVYGRDGYKWFYDAEADRYNCRELDYITCPWHDLLNEFGPITDAPVPEVGDEFTVELDSHNMFEYPEGSVYIDSMGNIMNRRQNRFWEPGSGAPRNDLPNGFWRRIA